MGRRPAPFGSWSQHQLALDSRSVTPTRIATGCKKLAAGWHLCLVVADRLLEGRPIPRIVGETAKNYGWEDLSDAYAETLHIVSTDDTNSSQT